MKNKISYKKIREILYLIRHSEQFREYVNLEKTQEENEKIILSIEGEKKAEKLSFNRELTSINEIWSSSYSRAVATAKYIAYRNNLKINIDERLNERKLRKFKSAKKNRRNKKISIYCRTNY